MAALRKNDLTFVKAPSEDIEIECPICLGVMLDDPHLVSCCGHHFCGPCIKKVKNSYYSYREPCQNCKETGFQIFPDRGRLQYINKLKVYCTNKGCGWKGELKSLSSHINAEKREGECQFEVVKCKYDKCEVKQQRQHLKIHEEEKCDQRPYDCQYCRDNGTYQYITQQHYPQCTRYPVPCPNECRSDSKFSRGDIEGHLSTVCPLQPVECEFKWAGCHYSPLRKDLPQHNIESQLNHMSLLGKSCRELKKENEDLKITCQKLKGDDEELRRNNEGLKIMYQKLNTDSKELKRGNEELKRDNSEMKQQLAHHVMVDHPILPFTISWDDRGKGVRYFYSEKCGHLMSVEVKSDIFDKGNPVIIIIKVYKKKFQKPQMPLVSEIVIKYRDDKYGRITTTTTTRANCTNYRETLDEKSDVMQEFKIKRGPFFECEIDKVKTH